MGFKYASVRLIKVVEETIRITGKDTARTLEES